MTLAQSDVSSLAAALSRWELGEYLCASLVTLGCFGEYVADFTNLLTGGVKERKERLAKCSTLLLIGALSLELVCLVRTNQISGTLIGSLKDEAEAADSKARSAIENSALAITQSGQATAKAGVAENTSAKAVDESNKASASASNALTLARGARREADSFERDILSAKKQAAEAEAHLAEALQRAANSERKATEVEQAIADRSITNVQLKIITAKLKTFKGQEYDVTAYWESKESVAIAERINETLQMAGWKFVPLQGWHGLFGGVVGVLVWVHPQADIPTKEAASALVTALLKEGIYAELREQNPTNNPKHNKMSLSVGSKR
jgi:hypothetical protein